MTSVAILTVVAAVLVGCSRPHPAAAVANVPPPPPVPAPAEPVASGTALETEVPIEQEGGTFVVPASINDAITLKFTLDSGAADVSIPADVASTLVRSGTISRDDYIGDQTFVLADGTQVPSPEFRIRTLKVGTLVLHDVVGSLADAKGTLLLGQSFLSRLTSWSIDNDRHVLVMKAAPGGAQVESEAVRLSRTDEDTAALLGPSDLQRAAGQFDATFKSSGMSGVSNMVDDCYAGLAPADRKGAAYCVTLDLIGLDVDRAFRSLMQSEYGKAVPPEPYYGDDVWPSRVRRGVLRTSRNGVAPSLATFEDFAKRAVQQIDAVGDSEASGPGA